MTDNTERIRRRKIQFLFVLFGRLGIGTATFGLFILLAADLIRTDSRFFLGHIICFVVFGAMYTALFGVQRSLMGRIATVLGLVWASFHLFPWPLSLWIMAPMAISALVVSLGLPYPKKILPPAPKKEGS